MLRRTLFWGIGFCLSVGIMAGIASHRVRGADGILASLKTQSHAAWLGPPWLWGTIALGGALVLSVAFGGREGWLSRRPGAVVSRFAVLALFVVLATRFAWVGIAPWANSLAGIFSDGSTLNAHNGEGGATSAVRGVLEQALSAGPRAPSVDEIMRTAKDPGARSRGRGASNSESEIRRPRKLDDPSLAAATLIVNDAPPGSEIFIGGVRQGKTPYIGELICRKGEKLKVDILPPKGMPKVLECDCKSGVLRPRARQGQ